MGNFWQVRFVCCCVILVSSAPAICQDIYDDLVKQIAAEVALLRRLPFTDQVPLKKLDRIGLREFLTNELYRIYPEGYLQAYQQCLVMLEVWQSELSLESTLMGLLEEQVAGLYDYHAGVMYLRENLPIMMPMLDVILAHELCHALQDQHFNLSDTEIRSISDEDRQMAAVALAEGDATLLMMRFQASQQTPEQLIREMFSAFSVNQQAFNQAPAFLQAQLLFPYLRGLMFVLQVGQTDRSRKNYWEGLDGSGFSWEIVNEAWRDPPTSTEQILHPEKYLAPERDEPITVEVADVVQRLGEPWKMLFENTYGELGIRLILETHILPTIARRAAAGWGGDRYVLLQHPDQDELLFWRTVWDEPDDATEFVGALERMAARLRHADRRMLFHPTDEITVEVWIGAGATLERYVDKLYDNTENLLPSGEDSADVAHDHKEVSVLNEFQYIISVEGE